MIDKLQVMDIVHRALEGTDKYMVDLKITTDNRIYVAVDGDSGITIDDCVELSRTIEGSLDREVEDYELNVASAGLDMPLKLTRQYVKNVGRDLVVTTTAGTTLEGRLQQADDSHIVLQPAGKKKAPAEPVTLAYADIKQARVAVRF